jgi:hypothetical protein
LKLPAAQFTQVEAPVKAWYSPDGHDMQELEELDVAKVPVEQLVQPGDPSAE